MADEKPKKAELIIQTNQDISMIRQLMTSGVWNIPPQVVDTLPAQLYMTTRGVRFKMDAQGKQVVGGDGRPELEKYDYSDSAINRAAKLLVSMMDTNKDVALSGEARQIEVMVEKRQPGKSEGGLLERMKQQLRDRGENPDEIIERGKNGTAVEKAQDDEPQAEHDEENRPMPGSDGGSNPEG